MSVELDLKNGVFGMLRLRTFWDFFSEKKLKKSVLRDKHSEKCLFVNNPPFLAEPTKKRPFLTILDPPATPLPGQSQAWPLKVEHLSAKMQKFL